MVVQAQLNSGAQLERGQQNMKLFALVTLQLQSATEIGLRLVQWNFEKQNKNLESFK